MKCRKGWLYEYVGGDRPALCDITTQQSDLLRKLVTELEHTKQVSQEVKSYYREAFENIEKQLDVSEYNCRRIE